MQITKRHLVVFGAVSQPDLADLVEATPSGGKKCTVTRQPWKLRTTRFVVARTTAARSVCL